MLMNTNGPECLRVGLIIASSSVVGRNTAQVKVRNTSTKKWARVFLGVFQGEATFTHMKHFDLPPSKTHIFKNVPISIVEIQCNEFER